MTPETISPLFPMGETQKGCYSLEELLMVFICSHLYPQVAFVERKKEMYGHCHFPSSDKECPLLLQVLCWVELSQFEFLLRQTLRQDSSVSSLVRWWCQETLQSAEKRTRGKRKPVKRKDQASYHRKQVALIPTGSSRSQ